MKTLWFVAFLGTLFTSLVIGCGETAGGAAGMGGADGTGGTGAIQSTPIEVTEASFDCILEGTKVRKFYVKNLAGDLEGSLAVANRQAPLPYPPGTLLQLVPQEAMVKREAGFSPETGDWEFFFLQIGPDGTTITERGKDEAENAFGGNCFACHALARDNDFVCETDGGCDPLMINDEVITSVQNADARCD